MPTNIAPVYNPNGLWQIWNYNDIYTGPTGTGQYVPKVGDQVNKIVGNVITSYIVTAVSVGNMLSSLTELSPPTGEGDYNNFDSLFGIIPNNQAGTYLAYIDKSVIPYRLAVDKRLTIKGSSVTSCKIFEGSDISTLGNVISATYDNSGNYTGENVGLELVADDAFNNNLAIKTINQCFTSTNMPNGELITAVFYDNSGSVVSKQQLAVVNTGFVRSSNASSKLVIGVSLLTSFLDATNSSVINYPLNLQMNVNNLTALVHYSDGSVTALPIDGTMCSISGLDSYVANSVGQSYPIVLTYVLQTSEEAYGINTANVAHVSKVYMLVTATPNLSYQTKLFAYPVWIDAINGYRLNWYLYNMNRSMAVDVTSYVTLAVNSNTFNPLGYGVKQTITASVNLSLINPSYSTFIYTQLVDITLSAPGTYRQNLTTPPNWYVSAITGITPMFGTGVYTTYVNVSGISNTLDVTGNFTTLSDWLNAFYTLSQPMVNSPTETIAPTPTHFTIVIGTSEFTYAISNWNTPITVSKAMVSNSTVFIKFILRSATNDLQLGVAGMPLYAVNALGAYI